MANVSTTISFINMDCLTIRVATWQHQNRLNAKSVLIHRATYTWKYISSLQEDVFHQDEANFRSNPVPRPVVRQDITRQQIKDMDIIFQQIPISTPLG